ncbi:MAG: hypothetical protein J6Y62_01410, partial [Clostridia bacterium]|nr:hypothetical protein [Clostridia bacterium]
ATLKAGALGLDTFGMGGFGGSNPFMNFSAYRTTYGNGDISSLQTLNDVPAYFRMINENNGGLFYWPTTLKEKYEWYRYFCYYIEDGLDGNQCLILLPDGTRKDIRDLNVGDEILDGHGRTTRVKEKIERECKDKFAVQFEVSCVQEKFKTTPEHPFFVLREGKVKCGDKFHIRKDIDFTPEWIHAEDVHAGDYMLCPLNVFEEGHVFPEEAILSGGYVLYRVDKADKVEGGGKVYNIGVESDDYDEQSYIANNVVSHNCRKDPVVKRAVEFHTDLPMSKLILRMPKMDDKDRAEKIKKRYEKMVKDIKLFDRLHSILFEMNVIGNCFLFVDYDERKRQWGKLIILPQEEVNIAQYPMSDISRVEYRPEQLKTILNKTSVDISSEAAYHDSIARLPDRADRMMLENVPYRIARDLLGEEGCIVLDTDPYSGEGGHKIGSFVYHFAEKRHAYYDLGVSPLECIIEPILMKMFMNNTQLSLLSRNMTPRNKVSAPDITPDQLDDLREQMDMSMLNPDYSIITNYDWNWELIGANERLIDLGREYQELNEQFYAGLGLTKEMITGEGLHSGSKINVELLNTRYMFKREILIDFVENCLFEPMAEENGWYDEDDEGNKTYYYPRLSFSRLSIRDNEQVFDSLFQLYQKGSLPASVIYELFNLDADEIQEMLKKDEFTPMDAVYNDMKRGVYDRVAEKIAETTDIADQIINNMTGPNGEKLKKAPPQEQQQGGYDNYGDTSFDASKEPKGQEDRPVIVEDKPLPESPEEPPKQEPPKPEEKPDVKDLEQ